MVSLCFRFTTAKKGVLGQLFGISYRRKRVAPHIFLSKSPYYYSSSSVCFCSQELEKLAKNIIRLHWEKVLILSVVIVEFFILTFWEKVFSLLLVDICWKRDQNMSVWLSICKGRKFNFWFGPISKNIFSFFKKVMCLAELISFCTSNFAKVASHRLICIFWLKTALHLKNATYDVIGGK